MTRPSCGAASSAALPCRKGALAAIITSNKGFSYMLAGGGIKPGITYGATDEPGYEAVGQPVSVHDFPATMPHLLGVNHLRLTMKYQGLDVRLTGISGEVVKGILA